MSPICIHCGKKVVSFGQLCTGPADPDARRRWKALWFHEVYGRSAAIPVCEIIGPPVLDRQVDDVAHAPAPRAARDHVALQESRWTKRPPHHAGLWLVIVFFSLAAVGLAAAFLNQ